MEFQSSSFSPQIFVHCRYKATVDADGDLKSVGIRLYCDCGYRFNEATVDGASSFAQNCYRNKRDHRKLWIDNMLSTAGLGNGRSCRMRW